MTASPTTPTETRVRPTVGIFGLTGCAGDQLVVLNCEDVLLDLLQLVDVRDFAMASSAHDHAALDIALVEGAVVTEGDAAMLRRIRARARTLVAIGTCAVCGGVPAIPSPRSRPELMRAVYGELSDGYSPTSVRALRDVVTVDAEITGCPIERHELLEALAALLGGNAPLLPLYPVCTECRIRENRCLLVEDSKLCVGPLTRAGCRARCPSIGVACVGCRGPAADANVPSARRLFASLGHDARDIEARLTMFGGARASAPAATVEGGERR